MIVTNETALVLDMHRARAREVGGSVGEVLGGRALATRVLGWLGAGPRVAPAPLAAVAPLATAKPRGARGVGVAYPTGGARPWLADAQADSGGWSVEVTSSSPLPAARARRVA